MERSNKTYLLCDLLENSVFGENQKMFLSKIAKQSTIFSFWDEIVGKKYFSLSKPYKIISSKLYISTKSPVVSQELGLLKSRLLKKINM